MRTKAGGENGRREAPVLNEVLLSAELLALNAALGAEGGDRAGPLLDELARELRTARAVRGGSDIPAAQRRA